jgi:hypothetical protein
MPGANQDRLFSPPRLEHFCPMTACKRRCTATTCRCLPCGRECEACTKRREIGARAGRRPIDITELSLPQPRLPGTTIPRSTP